MIYLYVSYGFNALPRTRALNNQSVVVGAGGWTRCLYPFLGSDAMEHEFRREEVDRYCAPAEWRDFVSSLGQAQTRSNALWAYRLCAHVSAPSNLSRSGRLYFCLVGFEFGSKSGTVSGSCTEQQKNRRHRSISQQDPVRHLG